MANPWVEPNGDKRWLTVSPCEASMAHTQSKLGLVNWRSREGWLTALALWRSNLD